MDKFMIFLRMLSISIHNAKICVFGEPFTFLYALSMCNIPLRFGLNPTENFLKILYQVSNDDKFLNIGKKWMVFKLIRTPEREHIIDVELKEPDDLINTSDPAIYINSFTGKVFVHGVKILSRDEYARDRYELGIPDDMLLEKYDVSDVYILKNINTETDRLCVNILKRIEEIPDLNNFFKTGM